MIDPLEQAFLRLRDAADADEYVPTEQVIDTVLARLATASRERDEALRLLATRVEAKRLDEAQEEIARLRVACTLALGVMEQKNRVAVLPTAKFVDVKFAPEDIAVLRAALEKKP